jgi:hypothetical protein
LGRRTKLRLVLSCVLVAFVMSPSFADEQQINLTPETPYVDVVVEATAPTQITIQTTTGTPQTNPGFIDSWIELWQGVTKLRADDDGAHSGTNVLASFISAPIEAGTYFIRATSFAWMASNQAQTPTGSYLLTWNGVTTVQPTPIPTPEPSPTETVEPTPTTQPTIEPTEQPSPTPIATDSSTPTPTQEPQPEPQPETNTNNQQNEPILIQETPTPTPEIVLPEIEEIEPEIVEQIVEEETIETPIVEPELSVEQINELYVAENTIELQIPTALAEIPGVEQIFAATEAIMNVGSDMTQEQREESQSVVIGAIIITQIASMASISVSQSFTRKLNK